MVATIDGHSIFSLESGLGSVRESHHYIFLGTSILTDVWQGSHSNVQSGDDPTKNRSHLGASNYGGGGQEGPPFYVNGIEALEKGAAPVDLKNGWFWMPDWNQARFDAAEARYFPEEGWFGLLGQSVYAEVVKVKVHDDLAPVIAQYHITDPPSAY